VGIRNDVSLYCLESFTLRVWEVGIKYNLSSSWEVQRIQFIEGNKILLFSSPSYLQIIEFGEISRTIHTTIPFYKRYLPTSFSQPTRIVENIIYFKNRIYILFT
jgi:hypothetical protein